MSAKFKQRAPKGSLVMNRQAGDVILINNGEIKLHVLEISGKQVRLAFQASLGVSIEHQKLKDISVSMSDAANQQEVGK